MYPGALVAIEPITAAALAALAREHPDAALWVFDELGDLVPAAAVMLQEGAERSIIVASAKELAAVIEDAGDAGA